MTVKQMNEIREQEFRPGEGLLGTLAGGSQGEVVSPVSGNFSRGKIETKTAGCESQIHFKRTHGNKERIND